MELGQVGCATRLAQDTKICVDANQGYPTPKAAVQVTKAMAEYDLLYMEQPVEGIDRMAEVARTRRYADHGG